MLPTPDPEYHRKILLNFFKNSVDWMKPIKAVQRAQVLDYISQNKLLNCIRERLKSNQKSVREQLSTSVFQSIKLTPDCNIPTSVLPFFQKRIFFRNYHNQFFSHSFEITLFFRLYPTHP